MSNFIQPKRKTVHVDYVGEFHNHPVNIDLCKEIISRDSPNGYGKKYPTIEFRGCGVTWNYGENGHKIRDEQYNEIIGNTKSTPDKLVIEKSCFDCINFNYVTHNPICRRCDEFKFFSSIRTQNQTE